MSLAVTEFRDVYQELQAFVDGANSPKVVGPLAELEDSAVAAAKAWSGSWLGYHSNVYYHLLEPPPPGQHFSNEWGLTRTFRLGSQPGWTEYSADDVREAIFAKAGALDLSTAQDTAAQGQALFESKRDQVLSLLETIDTQRRDPYLARLLSEAQDARVVTAEDFARSKMPPGEVMSRDSLAISQGFWIPPHVAVIADVVALRSPLEQCQALAKIAQKAASHLERAERDRKREGRLGTNVFIGHGRSQVWRDLRDFVRDRLRLPWDEFNRVPVAGITNIARLSEMLDAAAIAFVVMTAEDEHIDGSVRARMNVIHEAGLFQGRLGFTRAIVVLEEGCEEFSNIDGLGQIRFPPGNISAAFEEIRLVLEREGLLGDSR
jgi:predicted nucleotide-binding protein